MYNHGESGIINVFIKTPDGAFLTYAYHNRGIQQMNGTFGYVNLLSYGGINSDRMYQAYIERVSLRVPITNKSTNRTRECNDHCFRESKLFG